MNYFYQPRVKLKLSVILLLSLFGGVVFLYFVLDKEIQGASVASIQKEKLLVKSTIKKMDKKKRLIAPQQDESECIITEIDWIEEKRRAFQDFLQHHPYQNTSKLDKKALKKIPKKDRPDLAFQQDYLRTLDPQLGYVPHERKIKAYQETQKRLNRLNSKAAIPDLSWEERGPTNVAGRTRALMYDPTDLTGKKVWAGGASGGLWYTNDITSPDSTWRSVSDFWPNIAITAIAYDPNDLQTFYVGTGEGWWNVDAVKGAGLWKSEDAGKTWIQMTSSNSYYPTDIVFYFVNDLVVRSNTAGQSELLVAVGQKYNNGSWSGGGTGLYRSTDGGLSFVQVLPNIAGNPYEPADIEIAADSTIFVGATRNPWGYGGGHILYSSTGLSGSWSAQDFSAVNNARRVEIACAPANKNIIYAIAANAAPSGNSDIAWCKKSTDGGSTWGDITIPTLVDDNVTHFTRRQAWYDLILAVKPSDPSGDTLIAGGIDLHTSFNGGTTWTGISHWYGGFSKPEVHADQHAIIFNPNQTNEVLFGNDGGVYYSQNAGISPSPSFSNRNSGYNITQFYACASLNEIGSNYFLAGAQDNGTQKFTEESLNATQEVTGGDGGYCHIDQDDSNYQITSYVYSNFYVSKNGGGTFSYYPFGNVGSFINPTDYDSRSNTLYFAWSTNNYAYMDDISAVSVGVYAASFGSGTCNHIKVSPFQDSTIYIGTTDGKVYKIENTMSTSVISTRLDNPTTNPISSVGSVSCIELGNDENHILVTYSNYGIVSVWETQNGGLSWSNKEGNLPDMPIRWALYNPTNAKEVMLATEAGIYSTDDISAGSPDWQPSNTGLANVRCDMLKYRYSDGLVTVASHGRGLFTTDVFSSPIVWTGKQSSDWNNAQNWVPNRIPDASLDVRIPSSNVTHELNFNSNVACDDINIESGRTVSIGGDLSVMGSFTSEGTVILNGTSLQTIGNSTFNNLKINNSVQIRLAGDITIQDSLEIQQGNLDLNGFTIDLGSSGTLVENSGHIVTSTTGMITSTRDLNAPNELNVAGMGIVLSSTKNLGTTTIQRYHHKQSNILNILRTYSISPSVNADLNAKMVFHYNDNELDGLDESQGMLFRSADNGITWTAEGGVINPTDNTVTLENIPAFSQWTVSTSIALPFTILSFTAQRLTPELVELTWQTVQEEDNLGFEIEKSTDGLQFERVTFVENQIKQENVKVYQYEDQPVIFDIYYRLKKLHQNGTFTQSQVVFVPGSEQPTFSVYPNPFKNDLNILLNNYNSNQDILNIELLTENGGQILSFIGTLVDFLKYFKLRSQKLESGAYILKIKTPQKNYIKKIIKH